MARFDHLFATDFKCGWCSREVASNTGFSAEQLQWTVYCCPRCNKPTVMTAVGFAQNQQVPGAVYGADIANIPEDVGQLYDEARRCMASSCYTASVLLCRKLLMNIAVSQGAEEGLSFVAYIEDLAKRGFVPPNGRAWVDHIRAKGNEATHQIAMMSQADATDLLTFAEMLLKFIYEFPARIPGA